MIENHQYEVDHVTGCWDWTGGVKRSSGHARLSGAGERKYGYTSPYRLMYEQRFGPVPEGLVLHHECENKMCVNPEHLSPLTRADHMRAHRINGLKTKTPEAVEARVLELRDVGLTYREIEFVTGLHFTTVGLIVRRRAEPPA